MFPYLGEEMIRVFMEYLNRPRNQGPQTGNEACTDHVRYVESDGDSDSRCRSVPGVVGWNKPPFPRVFSIEGYRDSRYERT
jgi:hypothetical protein